MAMSAIIPTLRHTTADSTPTLINHSPVLAGGRDRKVIVAPSSLASRDGFPLVLLDLKLPLRLLQGYLQRIMIRVRKLTTIGIYI